MRLLIGITGKPGAGKDTVYDLLCSLYTVARPVRLKFADELVAHVSRAFNVSSSLFTNRISKDLPSEELFGRAPRQVLQAYGTDFARKLIKESIWVDYVRQAVYESDGINPVVITDVRFNNEAEMIRAEGGEIWRILRPDNPFSCGDHEAELGIKDSLVDKEIMNDGSLSVLRVEIDRLRHDLHKRYDDAIEIGKQQESNIGEHP